MADNNLLNTYTPHPRYRDRNAAHQLVQEKERNQGMESPGDVQCQDVLRNFMSAVKETCHDREHSQREDTQVSGIPKASRGDQATNPPNENLCGQTADTSNENQGDRGINPPNENRCGQTADTSNENQDDQGINPPNDNLPGQTTDTSNDNQGDEATKSDRSEQDDEYGTLFLSCWNLDI